MIRFISNNDYNQYSLINQYNFGSHLSNPFNHLLLHGEQAYILYQYIKPEADIIHITTDPQYVRQGLAMQMLQMLQQTLPANSTILCEVDCENTPAIGLYKKFGMVQYNIRAKYYQNGHDALCMKKLITTGHTT